MNKSWKANLRIWQRLSLNAIDPWANTETMKVRTILGFNLRETWTSKEMPSLEDKANIPSDNAPHLMLLAWMTASEIVRNKYPAAYQVASRQSIFEIAKNLQPCVGRLSCKHFLYTTGFNSHSTCYGSNFERRSDTKQISLGSLPQVLWLLESDQWNN